MRIKEVQRETEEGDQAEMEDLNEDCGFFFVS